MSSAVPSLADTRLSGADTALGTASVARTPRESCLPGMGPCDCGGETQVLSTQLFAHTPAEEICLLCAGFVVTRKEEPQQETSGRA